MQVHCKCTPGKCVYRLFPGHIVHKGIDRCGVGAGE